MLELIRCHCKGKHQDWSSAPLPAEGISSGIWCLPLCGAGAEEPASVNTLLTNQRSQLALILSCQTQCQSWHWCKGLADAKHWPLWFMAKLASRVGALKLECHTQPTILGCLLRIRPSLALSAESDMARAVPLDDFAG